MRARLLICLQAWGAGIGVLGLQVIFLYPKMSVGSALWQIPALLFTIIFPALLFFDFISRKYQHYSFYRRLILLIFLLGLSEIEFYLLPFKINQLKIEMNLFSIVLIILFAIMAALVVIQIIKLKKNLIIVQKEI